VQTQSNGQREPAAPGPPATTPPRVLLVDDDEAVRFVVAALLRRRGFEVVEACDGVEALMAVRTTSPDVVLSDLNMPRCNGEQLCAHLKGDAMTAAVPFILMTGSEIDLGLARGHGCAAVLRKPLPPAFADIVLAAVRSARGASVRASGASL
jgi:CheY-like chemotaxis protein